MLRSRSTVALSIALSAALFAVSGASAEAKTYRLAATSQPEAEDIADATKFADEVRDKTEGRVDLKIYPSSQLGDYVQVFEAMTRGEIDMAMQAIPSSADERSALLTFPMVFNGYDSAKAAFANGGYMFKLVDEVTSDHHVKLIGSWGRGMAGAAFAGPVNDPTNPDARHDLKMRVWPGGTTHYTLLERLVYSPATVPWAELYTALQTGVVDGYVGSTPSSAVENFGDVVKTWVDLQDHFTMAFFIMSDQAWNGISPEDQQVMLDAADEISKARFDSVQKADAAAKETLRANGAEIVEFTADERAKLIAAVRNDVWPQLESDIGPDLFNQLKEATSTQ
jgi:TRAP-type C4-dicarboxylate transport system substrate-binding protein